MTIDIKSDGSFNKTERFLRQMAKLDVLSILEHYGQVGVTALSDATPSETGVTSHSWSYETEYKAGSYSIWWKNSHVEEGANIAILLQYGHGTGTGGYVQGRDYINPALRPIFDEIANDVWKVVTSS